MVTTTLTIQDIWPCGSNKLGKIDWGAILPYIILPILLSIATISYIVTIIIMVVIGMGVLYVCNRPRQKNRSPFFFSWTIASCVIMLLVFEFGILEELLITQLEHLVFLMLLACTCYFFYKMKAVADFVLAKGSSKGKEYSPVLTSESQYCQICQIEVNERLFHSIWWDCCILRPNYAFFLAGQLFAMATLLFGTNLGFTTVCKQWEFSDRILGQLYYCDYAYYDFTLALSFVTCVYGVGYLITIGIVLLRQLFIYIPKYRGQITLHMSIRKPVIALSVAINLSTTLGCFLASNN